MRSTNMYNRGALRTILCRLAATVSNASDEPARAPDDHADQDEPDPNQDVVAVVGTMPEADELQIVVVVVVPLLDRDANMDTVYMS